MGVTADTVRNSWCYVTSIIYFTFTWFVRAVTIQTSLQPNQITELIENKYGNKCKSSQIIRDIAQQSFLFN